MVLLSVGGVPITVQASLSVKEGGDPRTNHAIFGEASVGKKGGDLRTDHASFGEEMGGDPRTDHASFCADVVNAMAATCSPYRPGELATQTAVS